MLDTQYHIVCDAAIPCGFRVGQRYFEIKLKYQAGICPNCNAPVAVVDAYTLDQVRGAFIETNRDESSYGSVTVSHQK